MGNNYKTYISYVIQSENNHRHGFSIVDFASPKFNFYLDNESQQVVKWAEEKQKKLRTNEKIIVLHFFHVSDIK